MLGDSNLVFRQSKWWLYFKSRRTEETSKETRIGVAIADTITGPYQRHSANPLFLGTPFRPAFIAMELLRCTELFRRKSNGLGYCINQGPGCLSRSHSVCRNAAAVAPS